MRPTLQILMIMDDKDEPQLLIRSLRCGGYDVAYVVVNTAEAIRSALEHQNWDLIFSYYDLSKFSVQAALALARELCPAIPFIVFSEEIDSRLIAALIKNGACDFIQTGEFAGLIPVIERKLRVG